MFSVLEGNGDGALQDALGIRRSTVFTHYLKDIPSVVGGGSCLENPRVTARRKQNTPGIGHAGPLSAVLFLTFPNRLAQCAVGGYQEFLKV